ncbi:MAG: hypothetical protein ABI666_10785 [Ferruginibacter sp.]
MSKKETSDLLKFLIPFNEDITDLAFWLRGFVWNLYPNCNELIYDNYNAVAFGWSPTDKLGDTFCSIAVFNNKYVHFGFYRGSQIADPEKMLEGKGNQYRYIKIEAKNDFPQKYIKQLLKAAYANSLAKLKTTKQELKGATIVKSISAKKKRPGIIIPKKK